MFSPQGFSPLIIFLCLSGTGFFLDAPLSRGHVLLFFFLSFAVRIRSPPDCTFQALSSAQVSRLVCPFLHPGMRSSPHSLWCCQNLNGSYGWAWLDYARPLVGVLLLLEGGARPGSPFCFPVHLTDDLDLFLVPAVFHELFHGPVPVTRGIGSPVLFLLPYPSRTVFFFLPFLGVACLIP